MGDPGDKRDERTSVWQYFTHLLPPETSQAELFDIIFAKRMKDFLDGYNVMLLAYGQTGSGKTHTLLGPIGFSKPTNEVSEVHGIIPRAIFLLFRAIQEQRNQGRKCLMTLTVKETEFYTYTDMLNKREIKHDKKNG